MKRFLIPLLLCFPMILWGQKKTKTQAKDYINSGKNLNQAEKLLTDLLNDSSSRRMRSYGYCFLRLNANNMNREMKSFI
ncbi:MAG: hypothetical protein ACFNUM_01365 [Segatella salivae]